MLQINSRDFTVGDLTGMVLPMIALRNMLWIYMQVGSVHFYLFKSE